jgi:hypothetical protein
MVMTHGVLKVGIGIVIAAGAAFGAWWYATRSVPSVPPSIAGGMTCDMGISAAKAGRGGAPVSAQATSGDNKTLQPAGLSVASVNRVPPPGPAPEGMVWIPGGEFWMGADEFPDSQPWHRVYVDGFWMDKTEVSNDQFTQFVKATGYVTFA